MCARLVSRAHVRAKFLDCELANQLTDAGIRVAARYIKTGVVKFPRAGCEQLMTQLLGLGSEKHDDAVDALVYLILGLVGDGIEEQKVHYV